MAAGGIVLMLVGMLTKSWFTMSQGLEISIGLRSVEMCHPIIYGCQTLSFSDSQMSEAQGTPAFFVWAQLTFWLGLVSIVGVGVAAGHRLTGGEERYSQWAAIGCGLMILLGFITLISFPDQSGDGFGVSWSPFVFFLGAGLALVGSLPAKGGETPETTTNTSSHSADFQAQYGVVRRSERLGSAQTDAVGEAAPSEPIIKDVEANISGANDPVFNSPFSAPPDFDEPPISQAPAAGPIDDAFSIGDLLSSTDSNLGRKESVEVEATIARFDHEGLTTIDADGERRLEWFDVIAVAVRRLPVEMAGGALFIDIVADYEDGHLPKPFRLTASTHANYELFGLPDDFERNARLLAAFIRRTNPEVQLDKRTTGFIDGDPARQLPNREAYAFYQQRYE